MKQRPNLMKKTQQGFTLVELLVVVSVLATMASIAAIAMDGYEQQAQEQLAETEMQRIASAINRFKEDTGYYPEQGLFPSANSAGLEQANFDWLFISPKDGSNNEIMPWNIHSGRGWNGPYLEVNNQERVAVSDAVCRQDGSNFNTAFNGNDVISVTDTFERNTFDAESCVGVKYDGTWVRREYTGQAYRYDTDYENDDITQCPENGTAGDGCIAVISAGEDSRYGTSDDLVAVIRAK